MNTTMPHLAMCLTDKAPGGVKFGQRIHGIWLTDGNFYFPISNGTKNEIHIAGPEQFGPLEK